VKIEMLRWLLPVVIAAVIPVFFLAIYLNSRHRRANEKKKAEAEQSGKRKTET